MAGRGGTKCRDACMFIRGRDFTAPWQSDDLRSCLWVAPKTRGHMSMRTVCFLIAAFAFAVLPAYGETRSVWIDDLTWPEVRDAIAAGKRTAIVYTGSSEQNGPHMVIGKHNFVAHYVAQRIAEELGDALVYPTLPFAVTGDAAAKTGHMRFPGSVTLPPAVYL